MTCIGNSGDLPKEVADVIHGKDLVAAAVLSGNRNFEGRVHPSTRANYLASPPLVVAYALAGRVDIDFEKEPIGRGSDGKDVFLKDIWPSRSEVQKVSTEVVQPELFRQVYGSILQGNDMWKGLKAPTGNIYAWEQKSTYIQDPPFFKGMEKKAKAVKNIDNAHVLLNLGDSITTDHISPAGKIQANSPAGRYLKQNGVEPKDFNTYGARRGNFEVMVRGTFANTRLINKMVDKVGPDTVHVPTGEKVAVYDAAERYMNANQDTIILAGNEYGAGSSRDWAAKGPYLQGVKAVIAQSYERIHRSNLVGMGVLPLEFKSGQSQENLGLKDNATYSINLNGGDIKVGQEIEVKSSDGKTFKVKVRIDTEPELEYYRNGGILHYVLRKLMKD